MKAISVEDLDSYFELFIAGIPDEFKKFEGRTAVVESAELQDYITLLLRVIQESIKTMRQYDIE